MTRYVGILLLTTSVLCIGQIPRADPTAVIKGRLEYVQRKDAEEFKHDKAFYVHENVQFLVVKVDRMLAGGVATSNVIVGVAVDQQALGIEWLSPDYGILDTTAWKIGAQVVVAGRAPRSGSIACSPPAWSFKSDNLRPEGVDSNAQVLYEDDALQRFYGSTVLCASILDVFIVRE